MKNQEPVVLELAPLPREQIGPFLLLGLEKDAGREQIEASWARRVIWARKQQLRVALEDINWAREMISDAKRRLEFDACSLNPDTSDGALRRLTQRYAGTDGPTWQPLDGEQALADYTPAVEVPDPQAVRSSITVPDVPEEVPAVADLLRRLAEEPLDPWALPLTPDQDPSP